MDSLTVSFTFAPQKLADLNVRNGTDNLIILFISLAKKFNDVQNAYMWRIKNH